MVENTFESEHDLPAEHGRTYARVFRSTARYVCAVNAEQSLPGGRLSPGEITVYYITEQQPAETRCAALAPGHSARKLYHRLGLADRRVLAMGDYRIGLWVDGTR
ncbi:MAG: hypothetical protein R3A44_44580 [Caldilineaceae bacterium]